MKVFIDSRVFSPYLVLLGELEVVVGFEALQVVGQVQNGDGWVVGHTCGRDNDDDAKS